jgi:hypothetical protein
MIKLCILLVLIATSFFNLCKAQYAKIPTDTNYFWKQFSVCGNYQYQIRYTKDTLVAGKVYNKYSPFGGYFGNAPCAASFIKHGFLRQDTINRRTFILDNNFVERPLYNFNKIVGDTMLVYQTVLNANVTTTILSVSTSTINGVVCTMQQTSSNFAGDILQEGLGSIIGGLYGHLQINTNQFEQFICFGKINPYSEIASGGSFYIKCFLLNLGLNNLSIFNPFEIRLYPNPFKNTFTIEFIDEVSANSKLTITNTLGQIVFTTIGLQAKQEIDVSFLSSGVYFVKVQNKEGLKVIKIIKE